MKQLIFTAIILIAAASAATGQNRSIEFVKDASWERILETAKQRNKPVFVDCYTDWCGPCRKIAKEVFTLDEVADFFNENFVNAKIEMEKNTDGAVIAEKYRVTAYPTFLFIDPQSGRLTNFVVGGQAGHEWIIEAGKQALDPQMNMEAMARRYESGDRDLKLVNNYITLLGNLNMHDKQAQVMNEFFETSTPERIFSEEGWETLSLSLIDPASEHFRQVVDNKQRFYDLVGREPVDKYLTASIRLAAEKVIHHIWEPVAFRKLPNAESRHHELIDALTGVDYPAAGKYLAFLETALLVTQSRWDDVLDKIEAVDREGLLEGRELYDYYRYNLTPLARGTEDKDILGRAVGMLNKKSHGQNGRIEREYEQLANQLKFIKSRESANGTGNIPDAA